MTTKLSLLATALLLASPCARADVPYAYLLGSPQVRRELRIPHQLSVRIVHNLNEAARLRPHGGIANQNGAAVTKQRKLTPPDALERQVMSWLSPSQKQRLEQIELQMGNPFIFEDWRFARRVGLSPTQHKKLLPTFHAAFQSYVKGVQSLAKANASWLRRLDQNRHASRYTAYQRQFNRLGEQRITTVEAALNNTLTPTQKAKWRALLGQPFRARLTYDTKSYPLD